ncbi:MAG: hypothetical protein PHT36_01515 [Patescibacteria group bacterium]|nr:hypothetical protein [Patescibacteria group bacterium]
MIKKIIIMTVTTLAFLFLLSLAVTYATTSRVMIKTNTGGATVVIDGRSFSEENYIRLKPGKYQIMVRKDSYFDAQIEHDAIAREKKTIEIKMEKFVGPLEINVANQIDEPSWLNEYSFLTYNDKQIKIISNEGVVKKSLEQRGVLKYSGLNDLVAITVGYTTSELKTMVFSISKNKYILTIKNSFGAIISNNSVFFLRRDFGGNVLLKCDGIDCKKTKKIADLPEYLDQIIPSPDNKEFLVYAKDLFYGGDSIIEGDSVLYHVNAKGKVNKIARDGETVANPRWLPDGDSISYLNKDGLTIRSLKNNNQKSIYFLEKAATDNFHDWVTDRELIITSINSDFSVVSVYKINIDNPSIKTRISEIKIRPSENDFSPIVGTNLSPNKKNLLISQRNKSFILALY